MYFMIVLYRLKWAVSWFQLEKLKVKIMLLNEKWWTRRKEEWKSVYWKGRNRICFGERDSNGQYRSDFDYETVLISKGSFCEIYHSRLNHTSYKVLKDVKLLTPVSHFNVCVRAKESVTPKGRGPSKRETKPMTAL